MWSVSSVNAGPLLSLSAWLVTSHCLLFDLCALADEPLHNYSLCSFYEDFHVLHLDFVSLQVWTGRWVVQIRIRRPQGNSMNTYEESVSPCHQFLLPRTSNIAGCPQSRWKCGASKNRPGWSLGERCLWSSAAPSYSGASSRMEISCSENTKTLYFMEVLGGG